MKMQSLPVSAKVNDYFNKSNFFWIYFFVQYQKMTLLGCYVTQISVDGMMVGGMMVHRYNELRIYLAFMGLVKGQG